MPFYYYGGKKGRTGRYPPPGFSTIVEPFAGSAGYALGWATRGTRVILVERDPQVVDLWQRLQKMTAEELETIECPPIGSRDADPFVLMTVGKLYQKQVTAWMVEQWPRHRSRLLRSLPLVRDWQVIEGDYTQAPDVRACWFIDPPYSLRSDGRNPAHPYNFGADTIDFAALGEWCRARRGQVIVCEQEGADWLPFRPLFKQQPIGGQGQQGETRVEVVWTRTPGAVLSTPRARHLDEARRRRRTR